MGSKVLITGGAGYIGSHVAHQMVDAGFDVTVIDNLSTGNLWALPEKARFIKMDISDVESLEVILKKEKFSALIHFAASILVGESVDKPDIYYRNNTYNSARLFDLARRHGIKSIVFSSTAAVYGNAEGGLIREDAPLKPINPYGWSKLMSEQILRDFAVASNSSPTDSFRYVILRYFNVAGARRDLKIGQARPEATHLVNIASEVAIGLRPSLHIFGTDYPTADGTCERDYIHVEDLSQAHLDALQYLESGGKSDVFNVGYGYGLSVRQVITAFKEASGVQFEVTEGPRRAGDPAILTADSSKIQKVLGWKPKCADFRLICKTAFEWEKKRRGGARLGQAQSPLS